ncbi:LLM class flavin-dependent oxidoreductase, partial [Rhizobiaceae sp. 2RAB30]
MSVEASGFDGVRVGPRPDGHDATGLASYLLHSTTQLTVLTQHDTGVAPPDVAAQQIATLDRLSRGRLKLDIVPGTDGDYGHEERFERLDEYLVLLKRLWANDKAFDHEGKFFKIVRGMSMPKPLQKPRPPVMSAGGSETGRRFACQHADICFLLLHSEDPKEWQQQISAYKQFARDEFGRDIQVWTYAP